MYIRDLSESLKFKNVSSFAASTQFKEAIESYRYTVNVFAVVSFYKEKVFPHSDGPTAGRRHPERPFVLR